MPKEYINPAGRPCASLFHPGAQHHVAVQACLYRGAGAVRRSVQAGPRRRHSRPVHRGHRVFDGSAEGDRSDLGRRSFPAHVRLGRPRVHETLRSGQDVSAALGAPFTEHIDRRNGAVKSRLSRRTGDTRDHCRITSLEFLFSRSGMSLHVDSRRLIGRECPGGVREPS